MAAGAIVGDGAWLDRLQGELRGLLAPVFAQARSRLVAFAYVGALLAEPGDRRSCWQLAEAAGHATPRRMQALLAEHAWDWTAALAALQRFILARLGDPGAIVVLNETAELKQGTATVGVARQHAGITGQVENCQTVVFAAYVTGRAHTLFGFRLYLPEQWCQDKQRRRRAHVPDEAEFATKPALGTAMITGAADAGVPFAWVAADEVYGRGRKLREACEQQKKGYVVAVPVNFQVRLSSGRKAATPASCPPPPWTRRLAMTPAWSRSASRSSPACPPGRHADEPRHPRPGIRLVTMAATPSGPRPVAPLPRPAQSRPRHLTSQRLRESAGQLASAAGGPTRPARLERTR